MGNNNQYPPQPSLIREGVSNSHAELVSGSKRMLKQVQHDVNFPKRTYSPRKRAAFTLAEVLITLGIIGVVAAMTMPSLIQNTKRQHASARLKKFISVVNQALISAELDYGPREDWDKGEMESSDSAYDFLNTYIKPYVKSFDIEKRELLGKNMATLRFVDGSQMSVKIGSCYDIYYDINGEKFPNERGRDIYAFILCRQKETCNLDSNQVRAFYCTENGVDYPTREAILGNCKRNGQDCTLLLEENQYEFPKDYPRRL